MMTFLPYSDFRQTAAVLDRQRLGKQRVETMMIMRIFAGQKSNWRFHPAVQMWKGYPQALMQYQISICNEWTSRGYVDNCLNWTWTEFLKIDSLPYQIDPWWLGREEFHASHRSMLQQKKSEYYSRFWNEVELSYWWPTKELKNVSS